jgi:hypothetical protein
MTEGTRMLSQERPHISFDRQVSHSALPRSFSVRSPQGRDNANPKGAAIPVALLGDRIGGMDTRTKPSFGREKCGPGCTAPNISPRVPQPIKSCVAPIIPGDPSHHARHRSSRSSSIHRSMLHLRSERTQSSLSMRNQIRDHSARDIG